MRILLSGKSDDVGAGRNVAIYGCGSGGGSGGDSEGVSRMNVEAVV